MSRKVLTLLGLALILGGCLALAYRQIGYTKREKVLDLGSLEASVDREKKIPIPGYVAWGMVAGGVILILTGTRKPA
jgi:hypothetical protein